MNVLLVTTHAPVPDDCLQLRNQYVVQVNEQLNSVKMLQYEQITVYMVVGVVEDCVSVELTQGMWLPSRSAIRF